MTAHLSAGPADLTCPRCTRQVDVINDRGRTDWLGHNPDGPTWHILCWHRWQADRLWLLKRQPETVLLGEER